MELETQLYSTLLLSWVSLWLQACIITLNGFQNFLKIFTHCLKNFMCLSHLLCLLHNLIQRLEFSWPIERVFFIFIFRLSIYENSWLLILLILLKLSFIWWKKNLIYFFLFPIPSLFSCASNALVCDLIHLNGKLLCFILIFNIHLPWGSSMKHRLALNKTKYSFDTICETLNIFFF